MDFKPKVRHRDAMLFYIAFGFFFLLGMAFLIYNDPALRSFSLFIIGFSGLMLFLLWQQNSAFDIRYQLLEDGIFLKRYFFKKNIPYHQIQKIEIIDQEVAAAIIDGKYGEEVELLNQRDFKAFGKMKDVGEVIKYASVPVVFNSSGSKYYIFSHSVRVKSDFILIQTMDGQKILISPIQMEEFVAEVKKRMS